MVDAAVPNSGDGTRVHKGDSNPKAPPPAKADKRVRR